MTERNEDKLFVSGRPIVSIFHNEDNLYSILKVKIKSTNTTYTDKEGIIVGYFPKLSTDESYTFYGQLKNHPRYGQQFAVDTFVRDKPDSVKGVVHYLSSDLFPGIGPKTAQTIVKKLGENALQKILDSPDVLKTIPRLTKEKRDTIINGLQQNHGMERIMVQLNEWGFGPQLSMKIYQNYREETLEKLNDNPYRLIEDVEGVGFGRADELGSQLGIEGSHMDRMKAGILYLLNQASLSEGHIFVPTDQLLEDVKQLLEKSQAVEIEYDALAKAVIELGEESKVVVEQNRVYMPSLYFSEVGIATKTERLVQAKFKGFKKKLINESLSSIEADFGVTYAPTQRKAIEMALNNQISILTGGPGTGKTTVVRAIVELYADLNGLSLDPKEWAKEGKPFPIALAAPTGRAAKRLSESTGLPAMTIHRLLGFTGQDTEDTEGRPVEASLIIIDETSMLDCWLAHQLLRAIPETSQVVLVGDQDQLPPVGPGQVLKDLLASGRLPVVELQDIYRQADGSSIIELAHAMKSGKTTQDLLSKTKDRSFIPASADQIPKVVEQVVSSALAKGFTIRDLQVLAPMYRGPAGIDALNKMIQEMVNANPDGTRKEMVFGDAVYRIGDKVLQLVNQPESNVFNGDMGEVISIFKANENVEKKELMIVSFDGIEVTYEKSDLGQLTLAYCCSVHKSQGSEFSMVILPITRGYMKMLRRNLLYTAITRAKNYLILCGDPQAFQIGIERNDDNLRFTTLIERLSPEAEPMEPVEGQTYELTEDTLLSINPMIGMEGITPHQFMTQDVDS
ncbi:exodeoxyribonuclease V alpha subunit [Chryseomicrobium aureum]|uniref:SF1B family DNA helicase RecD2 n=1 Tax=Chryseomicrobium aureum TaxID=1441723 RepID=UPI00195F04B7|nr:ATP-dependent RecD-like DNA helicase [Chryseomicrobium aureum]MBM7706627.1 exodeoxyribonuclease V alpha subunit [Chryseomicrobium aureum]